MKSVSVGIKNTAAICGPLVYRLYDEHKLLYIGTSVRGVFGLVAPVKAVEQCTTTKFDFCEDSIRAKTLYRKLRSKEIPKYAPMAYRRMRDEANRVINVPPYRTGAKLAPSDPIPTPAPGAPLKFVLPVASPNEKFTMPEKALLETWKRMGHLNEERNKSAILAMRSLTPAQRNIVMRND